MTAQSIDHRFIKDSNDYKQSLTSPLTDMADSGIASRITPLSSLNGKKVSMNLLGDDDDDGNDSIATEIYCPSPNLTDTHKRMIFSFHTTFSRSWFFSGTCIQNM